MVIHDRGGTFPRESEGIRVLAVVFWDGICVTLLFETLRKYSGERTISVILCYNLIPLIENFFLDSATRSSMSSSGRAETVSAHHQNQRSVRRTRPNTSSNDLISTSV